MLNYNQALPKETLLQDLQIKEIKPIMKLIVRGKKREFISAVGKSLNIFLPTESNTSTQSDKLTALWLSTDEWMIFSNESQNEEANTYEIETGTYPGKAYINPLDIDYGVEEPGFWIELEDQNIGNDYYIDKYLSNSGRKN